VSVVQKYHVLQIPISRERYVLKIQFMELHLIVHKVLGMVIIVWQVLLATVIFGMVLNVVILHLDHLRTAMRRMDGERVGIGTFIIVVLKEAVNLVESVIEIILVLVDLPHQVKVLTVNVLVKELVVLTTDARLALLLIYLAIVQSTPYQTEVVAHQAL